MFTGIIQTIGVLKDRQEESGRVYLRIQPHRLIAGTKLGDSISVQGVCLTVAKIDVDGILMFEVMPETFRKTNLESFNLNDKVNLEPAMLLSDRLGGHLVAGHVDAVAEVSEVTSDGENILVTVTLPSQLEKYVIEHGSIALDGISLTVARLNRHLVTVSLIKETVEQTAWDGILVGKKVNVEVDMIGKYVENMIR